MANPRQQTRKKAVPPSTVDDRATPESYISSEDFLIFYVAGETFGLRLALVAEIARLPELAHMPLVPPCLLGLSNLRGTVLPVMSLRILLGLPDIQTNEQSRVVILRGDAPVGLVVDRIERLAQITPNQLETVADVDSAWDEVIKGAEGEGTIKILSPPDLLAVRFAQLGVSAIGSTRRPLVATTGAVLTPARNLVSLLSLSLGQQEYALPLDRVREIIPLPDYIAELPRAENAVLGVMTVQDRLLPVVSLRALLGLPVIAERQQRSKIVVVELGGGTVGVVADATREILRIDPDIIDPAPALLTRGEGEAEISSICRVDNGRRLIALLSPDQLFRPELVSRILADQGIANETQPQQTIAMAYEQFIIFRLDKQDYGIPIAAVAEIVRPPDDITRLPKAPGFIDGVMNLRGSVVPIINLRRRFDLGTTEQAASRHILILTVGGVAAGFLVDSVSEIMKARIDAIQPAPEISQEQMRLISRVINLEADGRLILLVDPTQLLNNLETEVLAKFERSELGAPVAAP